MNENKLPEIPKEWMWVKVRDIIEKCSLTGKKVKQSQVNNEGKFPVVDQGQDFISGYVDDENLVVDCEPPIIVFGDHTKIIKYINFKFVAGADGVKAFKVLGFNPKAFYYLLKAVKLPEKGYARHFQFLEKSFIPLPPLPEQQKIVDILEEAFSKVDAGVEGLKKIKKLLSLYRQSVLKYAFEGKLTQKWRVENKDKLEPAEKLIEKIKKEREERYKQKLEEWKKACEIAKKEGKKKPPKPKPPKELLPITEEELKTLPQISKEWKWVRLGDLTTTITKGSTPTSYGFKYKSKGINFVKVENIDENGNISNIDTFIDKETNEFLKRSILKENDLLFSIAGTIGRVAVVKNKNLPANTNQALAIIRFPEIKEVYILYYFYLLKSEIISKQAKSLIVGVGRANLSLTNVSEFLLPLSPILEQQEIVEEIEYRLSIADKLEEIVDKLLKLAEKLKQSYLKYAFEGKLTEEWRKENPHLISGENSVEKLLEKIKAEKEKIEKQKRSLK